MCIEEFVYFKSKKVYLHLSECTSIGILRDIGGFSCDTETLGRSQSGRKHTRYTYIIRAHSTLSFILVWSGKK